MEIGILPKIFCNNKISVLQIGDFWFISGPLSEHSRMTSDVLGQFLTYLPTCPNQISSDVAWPTVWVTNIGPTHFRTREPGPVLIYVLKKWPNIGDSYSTYLPQDLMSGFKICTSLIDVHNMDHILLLRDHPKTMSSYFSNFMTLQQVQILGLFCMVCLMTYTY